MISTLALYFDCGLGLVVLSVLYCDIYAYCAGYFQLCGMDVNQRKKNEDPSCMADLSQSFRMS